MAKVDLKTLARELGVSVSTVSKALQDSHEISAETKARVMELAQQLHYQPNPYASSLRRQQTRNIAVIVPEVINHFFSLAIDGIESVAQASHYHVLIYQTHDSRAKEASICQHLQSGRTDGIIISLAAEPQDFTHLLQMHERGIPLVFFDRVCPLIDTARITTDDFASGFNATAHLLQQGAKRVAYLSLAPHLSIDRQRQEGYLEALRQQNLTALAQVVYCGTHETEAQQAIGQLLHSPHPPDGIFASVEKLALATYAVCQAQGWQIPQRLKVVGFANLPTAHLLNPPLSTVVQPAFAMGQQAAQTLFTCLKTRRPIPAQNVTLSAVLEPRGSSQGFGLGKTTGR
ncbi:MAG: LacI family transcriptional regulator [Bernardetiaceae bacterium]|jgi:LacI family transcriptional regulator|nr:LacI family transcriptional regulator [Bernardetiaceae bacterium]